VEEEADPVHNKPYVNTGTEEEEPHRPEFQQGQRWRVGESEQIRSGRTEKKPAGRGLELTHRTPPRNPS
jgi:hypothetical protein